jgi:uncharacterized protein YrzB (UPF0473 family)
MTEKEMQDSIASEVITLIDEEDKAIDFNLIDVFELNGQRYAVLQPVDPAEVEDGMDEDDAIIFRLDTDEDGEEIFAYIEDDAEWEAAIDAYNDLLFDEE